MPTDLLPTRTSRQSGPTRDPLRPALLLALAFHGVLLLGLVGWMLVHWRPSHHFGSADPLAGAIQVSSVHALPLPPRQPVIDKSVLASDKPNIAPPPAPPPVSTPRTAAPKAEAKPRPEPLPRADSVAISKAPPPRPERSPKAEPRPESRPPARTPQPETVTTPAHQPAPPTPKATTGETAGLQLPQSTTELRNGTATITVQERSFGDRYAYYIRLISQKVNESRSSEDPDPPDARGKRTVIRFTIDRDGTPTEAEVQTRSGSLALDRSALRAIQRIDTFGPLPAGDHLTVDFGFTDR